MGKTQLGGSTPSHRSSVGTAAAGAPTSKMDASRWHLGEDSSSLALGWPLCLSAESQGLSSRLQDKRRRHPTLSKEKCGPQALKVWSFLEDKKRKLLWILRKGMHWSGFCFRRSTLAAGRAGSGGGGLSRSEDTAVVGGGGFRPLQAHAVWRFISGRFSHTAGRGASSSSPAASRLESFPAPSNVFLNVE